MPSTMKLLFFAQSRNGDVYLPVNLYRRSEQARAESDLAAWSGRKVKRVFVKKISLKIFLKPHGHVLEVVPDQARRTSTANP